MKQFHYITIVLLLLSINLIGQEIEFKNAAEISLFNATKHLNSGSGDIFYIIGVSAKYKRFFYSDRINNLAIGLSIQNSKSQFSISGPYDQSGTIRYFLSHKITSPGIFLSDQLRFKREKIGFFLDLALSAKYHFTSNENRYLTYLHNTFEQPNPFGNKNDEIIKELSVNRIGFYVALQPGIEFYLFKNKVIYLAYSMGTNINSHYKETLIAATLPKIESYQFYFGLFSLGFRF